MAQSFTTLLTDLAVQIGVDPDVLTRTQELIVGDTIIGMYLEAADEAAYEAADEAATESPRTIVRAASYVGPLSSQHVVFFTLLGEVDQQAFPRIARTLLEANNLWAGTAGCTLGLQRGTGQVILAAQLPLSMLDGSSFSIVLDGFCDAADFWRAFVAGADIDDIGGKPVFMVNMA